MMKWNKGIGLDWFVMKWVSISNVSPLASRSGLASSSCSCYIDLGEGGLFPLRIWRKEFLLFSSPLSLVKWITYTLCNTMKEYSQRWYWFSFFFLNFIFTFFKKKNYLKVVRLFYPSCCPCDKKTCNFLESHSSCLYIPYLSEPVWFGMFCSCAPWHFWCWVRG